MCEEKRRIEWIDMCKCLSMIWVIWLHFGIPRFIDKYVHIFHMPIFFVLSGMVLNTNRSFRKFLVTRIKSLLIPYLSFGIIFYVIWNCIYLEFVPERSVDFYAFMIHILWKNAETLPLWGGIQWFLTCLFFAEILFFSISVLLKDSKIAVLISSVGISLVAMYIIPNTGKRLPLSLDTALVSVAFVGFGFCLKKQIQSLEKQNTIRLIIFVVISFLISVMVYMIIGDTNMRLMLYGENPILYLVGSLSGCIMMIASSILIMRLLDSSVLENKRIQSQKLSYFPMYLGKNTIILLYLHKLFEGLIKTFIELVGLTFQSKFIKFGFWAFMVVVFLIVSYPISVFVENHCGVILGRPNVNSPS